MLVPWLEFLLASDQFWRIGRVAFPAAIAFGASLTTPGAFVARLSR